MIYSLSAVLVTLILGVGLGILCIQIMRSLNPYFSIHSHGCIDIFGCSVDINCIYNGKFEKESLVDQNQNNGIKRIGAGNLLQF